MASSDPLLALSAEQRATVRGCVELKMQSVMRARKSESNPAVAKAREQEYAELEAIKAAFRS